MSFRFIDLFAGIGGFRLALESLGGRCVFSSETGLRLFSEQECKAVMSYPYDFKIPVSRTQMYRQFGNSVAINQVKPVINSMIERMVK